MGMIAQMQNNCRSLLLDMWVIFVIAEPYVASSVQYDIVQFVDIVHVDRWFPPKTLFV